MNSQLLEILERTNLKDLLPVFEKEGVDDHVLDHLSEPDLEQIGVQRLGDRKKLLHAFKTKSFSHPLLAQIASERIDTGLSKFVNSLGMPFVPVSDLDLLFAAWPVRVRDYKKFCTETGRHFPSPNFEQTDDHPMVMVSWNDANAFSQWLTSTEISAGKIPKHLRYRLPEDLEWSKAVGLAAEARRTAEDRSGKIKGYPWGPAFPPPPNAGNYHPSLGVDPFRETSPVGSFAPNKFGIYDLGGNIWEWCLDRFDGKGEPRVLRGASCFNDDEEFLLSSHRDKGLPDFVRNNNGMRLVLGPEKEKQHIWF